MTYGSTTTSQRTITAFFDSREDANEAMERLVTAGISRDVINIAPGTERGAAGTGGQSHVGSGHTNEDIGFWESLKDLFLPDEDRSTYAEGLRRGGYLITVRASDAQYERALDILDDEGTIDIEERANTWRQEGWTGHGAGASGSSTGVAGSGSSALGAAGPSGVGAGRSDTTRARTGEEVIPISEEQLRVGKREASHGRVRVRSYVIETPVQEQVNLRQEHVGIERRQVDRPAKMDEDYRERTIEAEERSEEAVVSKQARVKEELVVKKDVEERTETVSDTVRRTEVDVEDERGNVGSGTRGRTTSR